MHFRVLCNTIMYVLDLTSSITTGFNVRDLTSSITTGFNVCGACYECLLFSLQL